MSSYYPEGVHLTDPYFSGEEAFATVNCPKCDAELKAGGELGTDYTEPCSCGTNVHIWIADDGDISATNADE